MKHVYKQGPQQQSIRVDSWVSYNVYQRVTSSFPLSQLLLHGWLSVLTTFGWTLVRVHPFHHDGHWQHHGLFPVSDRNSDHCSTRIRKYFQNASPTKCKRSIHLVPYRQRHTREFIPHNYSDRIQHSKRHDSRTATKPRKIPYYPDWQHQTVNHGYLRCTRSQNNSVQTIWLHRKSN